MDEEFRPANAEGCYAARQNRGSRTCTVDLHSSPALPLRSTIFHTPMSAMSGASTLTRNPITDQNGNRGQSLLG